MIDQAPKAGASLPSATHGLSAPRIAAVENAIRRSHDYFLREQSPEAYWVAPLEADTTLESDYVFLLRLLQIEDQEKIRKAIRRIRSQQLPEGGWNTYEGGPEEINATVKAYAALKLGGAGVMDPALVRARAAIERMGGITCVNTYTRTYLSLVGQFPQKGTPAIPPEIILFPKWLYFNIYEVSSWSRAMLVPLSIIYALRPRAPVPEEHGISELFPEGMANTDVHFPWSDEIVSWPNFFLLVDRFLKLWERTPLKPFRRLALRRAEQWMLERFEHSSGLAGIYPAIVNSIIALRALGYPVDHFQVRRALDELNKLIMEKGDQLQFQPCEAPVWDTVLAMLALLESGMEPDHPALIRAAGWLLAKQTARPGDWAVKNPSTPAGGWYFEFFNEFYPDLDDTCVALMVLKRVKHPDADRKRQAQEKGLRWLLEMQCSNGGWGSFDRNNDNTLLASFPFADHNAMLDPPTADITGRILEMLSHFGYTRQFACVKRAIHFLRREQEPDGSWFGRWGVNYIYGTWQVLKGLGAIGEDMSQPYIQKGAEWLRIHQNPDGGWGETCGSYGDPATRGQGPSTPSQTAWAVMGLLAAGDDASSPPVLRGIDYLLERQNVEGDWNEKEFTGTGFPGVFYLRYGFYRNYFPLFALGMYRQKAVKCLCSQLR